MGGFVWTISRSIGTETAELKRAMEEEQEEEGIEESTSVRLLSSTNGGGGEFRWVDGSEVDSESLPWPLNHENQEGYGSVRRRLVKKPKRVDSFDVEAMEIAASHGHHTKVCIYIYVCVRVYNVLFSSCSMHT